MLIKYDIVVVSLFHVYNIVFDFLSNYIQQKVIPKHLPV